MPGVVIIGAGPGLGFSVARRFARGGLPVALVARSEGKLKALADALAPTGVPVITLTADSTDETALRTALDTATAKFGVPEAVVYNAAIIQRDRPGELSVPAHQEAGRSTCWERSPPRPTSPQQWPAAAAVRSSSPAECPSRTPST